MPERLAVLVSMIMLASMIIGCEASEPSEAKSREQPSAPVEQRDAAPSPTPVPEADEAISITLPTTPSRPPGGGSGSGVEAPVSETFGPGSSLPECLSNCQGRQLSDDNRATCRLLCESHHGRSGSGSDAALVDVYVGCFDQCEGEASCRTRCASEAGNSGTCARGCLDSFGRCLTPCQGVGEEGRCSERCETTARSCVGDC